MIKLNEREMKNLSRILSVVLCFAPFAYVNASTPVATTAGSNLTAYNPSNANNNQWATLSNGRYDTTVKAKADFGNCNALILRCAQPKCANGGCAEVEIAAAIVKGCVQSNKSCAQYGDDLVEYMSAQLVASSNAKINEQNAAAAVAAQQQSEQQIQQMQYQMQQMQQQMVAQQEQSQQQLQEALAQQAAQNQAALENMKTAATEAAKETEAGISAYQQEAINRGISEDVLTRQTITGQIMTEIENAETSLKEAKVAMNNAFEYAKCDARGNNCSGPKRVKKWRELASEFLTPYDNTIDNIYDALMIAQTVGVDLSQIYMMLNNSCNQWGQYLCPQMAGGTIDYPSTENGQKGTPLVCSGGVSSEAITQCRMRCVPPAIKADGSRDVVEQARFNACSVACDSIQQQECQPCTLIKVLTESDDDRNAVYEGWVNAEYSTDNGNTTVVACASSALDSAKLFTRRTKNKNGAGLVDIDNLDTWLHQAGISKHNESRNIRTTDYCFMKEQQDILESAALSRSIVKGQALCVSSPSDTGAKEDEDCPYINPIYAICDTHQYNAGFDAESTKDLKSETIENIKEIIGLKTTVVSQQMYKQYEYLNATLRRLKTQLEKAALTTTLQAAGAKSEDGSSSSSSSGGLLGGNTSNDDKTIHLAGANNCSNFMDFDSAYSCLQTNVSLIKSNVGTNTKKACLQLQSTVASAKAILGSNNFNVDVATSNCKKYSQKSADSKSCADSAKTNITACADEINFAVMKEKRDQSQQNRNTPK